MFPERKLDEAILEEYRSVYKDLLGFVPPRIQDRTDLLSRLDPALLSMQEEMRSKAMNPACFDEKTTQLMLFGMLLMSLLDAAKIHAVAARRAGATWEELNAVVGLAFLFRGLPAANRGAQIMNEVMRKEVEEASQEGGIQDQEQS